MKEVARLCVTLLFLLVTSQRLPAPIQEVPEGPTPPPEQSAKPKPKRTANPKATSESSETSTKRQTPSPSPKTQATSQRKFAGTWKGTLDGREWVIVVDANETQGSATGGPWGIERGAARINQNTISWSYVFNSWSLTVSPGKKMAQVVLHYIGGTSSGTFEKNN
jgi:hypothetical protein